MEAELIKENILTSYPSANLNLTLLAEGETIVPDTKKDIDEIICVEGRSFLEKTEVKSGRIIFTGTAEFTVLYRAENCTEISSLCAKIPFNHIEECMNVTEYDKFTVRPETIRSECFLLNSRKISLKSLISVKFLSYLDISLPLVTEIKSVETEVKKEAVAFSYISACINESFTVSDFLSVPSSSPPVKDTLLCRVSVNDCSLKAVTGKAVAKGTLSVFRLYLTLDETISHMQHDIPFTEIIDVPGLSDDMLSNIDFYVKSCSVAEDFSVPDEQTFSFSAEVHLSAISFSTKKIPIVSDAYIPGYETNLNCSTCRKSEVFFSENSVLTVKGSPDLPADAPPMEQICPLFAHITDIEAISENDKLTVNGKLEASITYLSSGSKNVTSFVYELPFSQMFDCTSKNPSVLAKASVSHIDYNLINQAKLDIRCLIDLSVSASDNNDSFPCIDNMIVGDASSFDRPSIIIYFVKSGDTLWDIAKRYRTTEEKILSANAMEKEDILNIGMRILIPM